MGGLRQPWSIRFQVLVPFTKRIQAGLKNVVKVIINFIEGKRKGKELQKKEWWAPAKWDRSAGICFKDLCKLKGQRVRKIWVIFAG
jgi:hypothetical protein